MNLVTVFREALVEGGPGSGHYGHAGRPGTVGGSVASSEGAEYLLSIVDKKRDYDEKLATLRGMTYATHITKTTVRAHYHLYDRLERVIIDQRLVTAFKAAGKATGRRRHRDIAIAIKIANAQGLSATATEIGKEITDESCAHVMRGWALSANNDNPYSLALQAVAAKTFKRDLSEWQRQKVEALTNGDRKVFDDITSGFGAEMQTTFLEVNKIHTKNVFSNFGLSQDDFVLVYRGQKTGLMDVGSLVNYTGNVLESWSFSLVTAMRFSKMGYGRGGVVLGRYIKVSEIFSSAISGLGCYSEQEVIIPGDAEGDVVVIASG